MGDQLILRFDEKTAPFGGAVRGEVVLTPELRPSHEQDLSGDGEHRWWPVAPRSRARVRLEAPALSFEGSAYHDANLGHGPLEDTFDRWWWARAPLADGAGAAVLYDVTLRDGRHRKLSLHLRADGTVAELEAPEAVALGRSRLGLAQEVRTEPGGQARLLRRLTDTPFYARNLIETRLEGARVRAMHEVLDLRRFSRSWVRFLLPFRMRRYG